MTQNEELASEYVFDDVFNANFNSSNIIDINNKGNIFLCPTSICKSYNFLKHLLERSLSTMC